MLFDIYFCTSTFVYKAVSSTLGNWYLIQYAWNIHLSQNQQHLDDEDSCRGEGEWVVVNNCRQSRVAHFNQTLSLQHDSRSVSNLISSHYRHPPHQPRFIRSPSSHLSLPEARPKFIGSVECTATAAPPPTPRRINSTVLRVPA